MDSCSEHFSCPSFKVRLVLLCPSALPGDPRACGQQGVLPGRGRGTLRRLPLVWTESLQPTASLAPTPQECPCAGSCQFQEWAAWAQGFLAFYKFSSQPHPWLSGPRIPQPAAPRQGHSDSSCSQRVGAQGRARVPSTESRVRGRQAVRPPPLGMGSPARG